MDKKIVINLQRAVGANVDGFIGKDTLKALFIKLGCPKKDVAEALAINANIQMRAKGIFDNELRFAHFIAQCGHESGGFVYMEEIASGAAYEGRKDLGNVVAGDGKRYKGRGPIQLTGRANYRRIGLRIGLNLENNPTLVADPSIGMWCALEYWDENKLNKYADADDTESLTRRINGGYNGLADRKERLKRIKSLMGI